MSTKITIDNTQGKITSEGNPITPQYYDISGEVAGVPTENTRVFNFKTARAFTLKASSGVAGCITAPSGSTVFTIKNESTSTTLGTITFTSADTVGAVSISSDASISAGHIISVTSPPSVNSIDTPFWTLVGVIPS